MCRIVFIRLQYILSSCVTCLCFRATSSPHPLSPTLFYLLPFFSRCRSLMLTVWPGTPSVRTCCASPATATLTSRRATSLCTSRKCRALWLATMAPRSSASMFIPCLLLRCLRCVDTKTMTLKKSYGVKMQFCWWFWWSCSALVGAHVPIPGEEDV